MDAVRFLSRLSSTDASGLGPITIDLLNGTHGPQRTEIEELIRFLCDDLKPDVILFSNALLSGVVPELRRRFSGRLCCLLQGDDVFLEGLPEPWRSQALALITRNAAHFDGLLTHSQYYADFMQSYLALPADRFRIIPLTIEDSPLPITTRETLGNGVDLMPSPDQPEGASPRFSPRVRSLEPGASALRLMKSTPSETTGADSALTVGYFARICPEKGAFRFLDAAERILPLRPEMRMIMGGYLPEQHRRRFELRVKAIQSTHPDRLTWAGSPADRDEKFRLIQSFDWLCVPGEYREPKGLYVLEAALLGVPSLIPAHGAFPERISALGSGILFDPDKPDALQSILSDLQSPTIHRTHLREKCLNLHGLEQTGRQVLEVLQEL